MERIWLLAAIGVVAFTGGIVYGFTSAYKKVIPSDPGISYIGRIDFSDKNAPRFDWPGIEIAINFEGAYCAVLLDDGTNHYNVFVDGARMPVLVTQPKVKKYIVAKNLSRGPHSVIITKRTETYDGTGIFKGFILDKKAKVLAPPVKPSKKIEFIGDSLTVGYGIEGPSVTCGEGTEKKYKNNFLSFASVTSRVLGAQAHIIAISGRGLVKNYGDNAIPAEKPLGYYYKNTIMNDPLTAWDFKSWIPDIVVINIGTNDFSTQPVPSKELFEKAYLSLLKTVRGYYPQAEIFCVTGPVTDAPLSGYVKNTLKTFKDKKTHFASLSPVPQELMGCDWHPNAEANRKMAEELVKQINSVMQKHP
ncbi:MAG TPA: SGNH/GDSL hydrolase family protein [Candidatus Goldiibacteriota bacterium]|nr:SGNH/GDSL hydrolase family protein [Candidatus Goldiibacteriota bacterium]HPN64380.1 SGNH/GDSL hydrolase family protein [Candidatus Goldiibacteriota bacterium]HRQ42773.1 SGNH/GDSL hydrolase family protein [Candidatus Goldiibacteriota bacterium]